jgi:site-specific DNA-methyltransferase (adenine-specific)
MIKMELNTIYNENCLTTMQRMGEKSVDLIVTSPPYDNLRDYNGYDFNFEDVAWWVSGVLKENGILVWVVGDAVLKGSESGTSFKQALFFKDTCKLKLHDTMIYEKNSASFPARRNGNRYTQIFEYMFVFAKGKVRANLICDKPNKWAGHTSFDGKIPPVPNFSPRNNIWKYTTSFNDKTGHPAVFPEQLAEDHILSWSNKGDIVYDPFGGSGTVAKMAHKHGRNWILSEISDEYVEGAKSRLEKYGVI